jgi:RHS repeat-associated protein
MTDNSTGLTYLRARYYSVAVGRFTSRDVWAGDENRPVSYNSWLYAYGNPANLTDPSGHSPVIEKTLSRFVNANDNPPDRPGLTNQEMALIDAALVHYIARAYARSYSHLESRMRAALECLPPEIRQHLVTARIDPISAFLRIHGHKITFEVYAPNPDGSVFAQIPGQANDRGGVNIFWGYHNIQLANGNTFPWGSAESYQRFIVHEMGHVFNNVFGKAPQWLVYNYDVKYGFADFLTSDVDVKNGFFGTQKQGWQRRGDNYTDQFELAGEIFADQYLGWVYDKWEVGGDGTLTLLGQQRSDFMEEYMSMWIHLKLVP